MLQDVLSHNPIDLNDGKEGADYMDPEGKKEKNKTSPRSVACPNESPGDAPPDGGLTAWLIIVACFLLNFNVSGINYSFGVYQAHYFLHEFPNYSAEVISLIGATCLAVNLGISVFVGRWVEIYGAKIVTIIGSVVFSGSLVAAGFCHSIPSLIITQGLLNGIGAGLLYNPAITAPLAWFSKKRSLVLGISSAGTGIGGICWSFLTRLFIMKLSYQWSLWITACISALLNIIAVLLIKNRSVRTLINRGSFRDSFALLKDPRFLTIYIGSGLCVFGYFIPFFYVPTYAQTQLHTTPLTGSILVVVMDLGLFLGRIFIGRVADSWIGTMNSIGISIAIAGLCQLFLWLPASNSLPLVYVFSFVYGFFGGNLGLSPAILSRIYEAEKIPSIAGLLFSSQIPGLLAGEPIAGLIFSKGNENWSPVIIYSAMTVFFGSVLILATRFQVERRIFVSV